MTDPAIELATLRARLDVCIEIHEQLSAPWADIYDTKGWLTAEKRKLRRKIRSLQ